MFLHNIEITIETFVFFVLIIKFCYFLSNLTHIILSHTDTKFKKYDDLLVHWKNRFQFLFIFTASILLVYYFVPTEDKSKSKPLSLETKIVFFVLGLVLIVHADWSTFIKEAPWYKSIFS